MQEQNDKDLELFFQQQLNENPPSDSNWDVPSDAVWGGIEAAIQEPKRRRPLVIWWSAAAAVLALGFALFLLVKPMPETDALVDNARSGEVEHPVISTTPVPKSLQDSFVKKMGATGETGKGNSQNLPPTLSPITAKQATQVPSLLKDTRESFGSTLPQEFEVDASLPSNPASSAEIEVNALEKKMPGLAEKDSDKPVPTHTPIAARQHKIARIPSLPKSESGFPIPAIPLQEDPIDVTPKVSPWYIGAAYAPTYNHTILTRKKNINHQIRRDIPEPSHSYSLSVGRKFSKNWAIETGVRYNIEKIKSTHYFPISYSSDGEILSPDGNYIKDYSVTVSTRYGDIDTDLTVLRSPSTTINEGEQIGMQMNSTLSQGRLHVPFLAKFTAGKRRLKLSAKAGVQGNFLVKRSLKREGFASNNLAFDVKESTLGEFKKAGTTTTVDFVVGLGADYQLTPNLHLFAEPTFACSMVPLFPDSFIKTYPATTMVNFGLNYHF